jgi:hypothetical protein
MAGLVVPEQVTVALAEIAGLQVMQTLMEESMVALAGPKGKHNPTAPLCATATSRAR